MKEFTAFFAFCGAGGGALGFQRAEAHLLGQRARIRVIGGFDVDPTACANFGYLTGVEATCIDVRELTPGILREITGGIEPDVVFDSAPCVGATKLITDELAATEKYVELNKLGGVWTRVLLATWRAALIIKENVPNIVHRARGTIGDLRKLLRGAGYLVAEDDHELGEYGPPEAGGAFYDAGALGGLAQRRKRWLLVARDPKRCAPLLYRPPRRRVRGVGEVLGPLPLPDDPAGGPMHRLPRLSAMNWIRLALIPAGGDWRDLPGVLAQEQERRAVHRRMHLARWEDPSVTVGGPGTNGPFGVADPRVVPQPNNARAFDHKYRVEAWENPSHAVTGADRVGSGAPSVADPRLNIGPSGHTKILHVTPWGEAARTVTGAPRPSTGAASVADPRVGTFPNGGTISEPPLDPNVVAWGEQFAKGVKEAIEKAMAGGGQAAGGASGAADPRLGCAPHSGAYGVTGWGEPAATVTGSGSVDNARQAVADPRAAGFKGVLGVVPWDAASGTVTGNARPQTGPFNVADPRVEKAFDKGYAVIGWGEPANAIAGTSSPGCGTYSVADPRPQAPAGWLTVDDIMVFLETPGPWAIVDRTSDGPPLAVITDLRKPSPIPLRIVARDNTWHRPLTVLELAVLQGLPAIHNGAPLQLTGPATTDRLHVGNLVPPPAAQAIAEQMLIALLQHEAGAFSLSGGGAVWVDPQEGAALQ